MHLDLPGWAAEAQPLIAAAIERREPYKLPTEYAASAALELRSCLVAMGLIHRAGRADRARADRAPDDGRASTGLSRGAGYGAFLDVLRFLTECHIPLPSLIAEEVQAAVLTVALGEGGTVRGGPARAALAVRRNVIRRLRFEHMERVLCDAVRNDWERHEMLPAQARQYVASRMHPAFRPLSAAAHAKIVAAQPEAAKQARKAAAIVRKRLGQAHRERGGEGVEPIAGTLSDDDNPEMVERDWRSVRQVMERAILPEDSPGLPKPDDLPRCWPCEFYLPTADTLRALGLDDLLEAMTPWGIASDAPALPSIRYR